MIEFGVYFSFLFYTQKKKNIKKTTFFNKICHIIKINAAE